VRQVIEWVADHFHARELVRFGARPQRDDEPSSLVADTAKVAGLLGWHAETSIEEGLERLMRETGASFVLARILLQPVSKLTRA
jgi:nucleoside-diphosphate-sugar epimerase